MSLISKKEIWKFTLDLYPIYRCLTGEGVRETLSYIKNQVGSLKIDYFKSGLKAYDWIIPNEWSITDAYIECDDVKIIDFKKNNLHVVGYSSAVNKILSYNQLIKKLHYLKDLPNAIPYRTNYYLEDW